MNLEEQSSQWVEKHYPNSLAQRKLMMAEAYEAGYLQSAEDGGTETASEPCKHQSGAIDRLQKLEDRLEMYIDSDRVRLDSIEDTNEAQGDALHGLEKHIKFQDAVLDKQSQRITQCVIHEQDHAGEIVEQHQSLKDFKEQCAGRQGYQSQINDELQDTEHHHHNRALELNAGHQDRIKDLEAELSNMKRRIEFLEEHPALSIPPLEAK